MRKTLLIAALAATIPNLSFAATSQISSSPFVGATSVANGQSGAQQTDVAPSTSTASGLQASTAATTGTFHATAANPLPPGGNAYLGYGADASGSDQNGDVGNRNTAVGTGATTSDPSALGAGSRNTALGSAASATGGSDAVGQGTLAAGSDSTATGAGATAVGPAASAGGYSTALGVNSSAAGGGIAVGNGANSTMGLSLGNGATTSGTYDATAIGTNANAQSNAIAISAGQGNNPAAAANGSVAINGQAGVVNNGMMSFTPTNGVDSIAILGTAGTVSGATMGNIAIGLSAEANATTGLGGVAIGQAASATGANSVAIGSNSSDSGLANVFSVGSAGQQRSIINVAPGINATDGVNVSQLPGLWGGTAAAPVFVFGSNAGSPGGSSAPCEVKHCFA